MIKRKPKIFVSYRRDDGGGHAGRLHADLVRRFGADQIFFDIGDIQAGEDFAEVIEGSVKSCDVLLAIIGKQWLTVMDAGGRRLDNPQDFVRLEITNALKRNIPVIPVLVQGASIPRPEDLPGELEALARRQVLEVTDSRWDYDVNRLVKRLDAIIPKGETPWLKVAVVIGGLIALSSGAWMLLRGTRQDYLANSNSDVALSNSSISDTNTNAGRTNPNAGNIVDVPIRDKNNSNNEARSQGNNTNNESAEGSVEATPPKPSTVRLSPGETTMITEANVAAKLPNENNYDSAKQAVQIYFTYPLDPLHKIKYGDTADSNITKQEYEWIKLNTRNSITLPGNNSFIVELSNSVFSSENKRFVQSIDINVRRK